MNQTHPQRIASSLAASVENLFQYLNAQMELREIYSRKRVSWLVLAERLGQEQFERQFQKVMNALDEYDAYLSADGPCPGGTGAEREYMIGDEEDIQDVKCSLCGQETNLGYCMTCDR